jgi:hypothetical protein
MSNIKYICVGTSFFKKVKAPTISGDFNEILVPWNIDTIKQDYGKTFIGDIPKYDGFTCILGHTNFQQICSGFYNKYSPLSNKPKNGSFEASKLFIEHIFGNQIELGLDDPQLLYQKPVQILPILCLVSKERSTGKLKKNTNSKPLTIYRIHKSLKKSIPNLVTTCQRRILNGSIFTETKTK